MINDWIYRYININNRYIIYKIIYLSIYQYGYNLVRFVAIFDGDDGETGVCNGGLDDVV